MAAMVTPTPIAAKKRDAASPVYTANGLPVPPGIYGEWLTAVVNRFGGNAVAEWRNDAPQGWTLNAWLAMKRARALDRAG